MPQTAEKVLKELHIQFQDHQNGIFQTSDENTCLTCVAVSQQEKPWCPCPQLQGAKQELCQRSPAGFASGKGCSLQGFFQMLASEVVQEKEFASLYNICRFLIYSDSNRDTQMLSLVLRAPITMSERDDRVSRMVSGADRWKLSFEARDLAWAGSQDAEVTAWSTLPDGQGLVAAWGMLQA